uniref:hypothetical protein n=1 Tax=Curtobacterium poinsettiae TaxID=159612 RepID=UPI002B413923|nr:hypothetical protein [Curtobacterium flaccumfaciens]WQM79149.1 hypothetical protein PCFP21_485 [Curtobacterium flaccumfaciens pv. poinsettiae]WQM79151.1 hypothetical protein PCFP23_010 [Curtobacterium flaccumfaciens pv. poinsettiae]WQM79286.1 hypothetical protein PCFP24_180 [Curtobacterium flaccumfaciens pv. poinsettiae]WQM79371.1 hypothetical protein PCFP11_120 [Curtobacterium flaccumfaciens pv. poinsettiae]WQM79493.1 hypothetical protein PCFP31_295 [Curtobacterium flaccumfaciens pv. poins
MTGGPSWITVTGIATVISVWIAAAAMLFPNVRGKNSMLPTGVVFWAIGCSLQAPWLYVVVDRFLGGENLTNLLYRSAVIVALGCLEVMVIRAMSGSRIRLVEAGVWAVTFVMIATQSALFMAADWSVSDPYLGRYTGEPLRELFAAILPICVGLFGIQVLRVAFKGLPGYGEWTTRWGVSLIGVAAVVDLLWVSESLVIGVVRATVAPHALMTGNVEPLWEIAVVSMCVVTAVGVVVAAAHPVLVPAWRRVLLIVSIPVSDRAMLTNPEYSVHTRSERHQAAFRSRGEVAELALWQRWAELEDNIRLRQFQPRWYERQLIHLMMGATSASFAGSIVPQLLLPNPDTEHRPGPTRIESTA